MTQWDKPINYQQFLGIKAQLARELKLTPAEWMRVTATNVDSAGEFQNLLNTSGQVTEVSASGIATSVSNQTNLSIVPMSSDAAGVAVAWTEKFLATPTTTITADGAGNIGTAAIVVNAVTSKRLDVWLYLQVDTTGTYLTKWCEDPSGTPAPGTPDYHTTGQTLELVAGYPYLLCMKCDGATGLSFGYDAGTNGDWPNSSNMVVSGHHRGV